jgi:pyrroloquinoline quinone biosynthesis protein B
MIRQILGVLVLGISTALAAPGEGPVEDAPVMGAAPYILVLGVAQDASYPQAECYRPHCMRGWDDATLRRTATSIAVVDPESRGAYLFDATPDMPEQLYRLRAATSLDNPYALDGVFLTHGHIGHYTGLMHFGREVMGADRVPVYAMPRMRGFLSTNGPWDQLVRLENIELRNLDDGAGVDLRGGITVTPFLVPHRDEYTETVGYRIDGPNRSAIFIPDIDKWDRWEGDLVALVRDADFAFIDATFYEDGEIPGRSMEDIPHPFVVESMTLLEPLTPAERARVHFIHFNHTNPLLIEGSGAQGEVRDAGFTIAAEGMRLEL